jgi:hypothetical protein
MMGFNGWGYWCEAGQAVDRPVQFAGKFVNKKKNTM